MAAAVQTMLRIAPAIANISYKISFIGETQQIPTDYGQVRTGDVQAVWGEINMKIVDTIGGTAGAEAAMVWDFAPDGTYGPTMLITPNILTTYGGPGFTGDEGINYVLTHEIAHMTNLGNQVFNTQIQSYLAVGGSNTMTNWNNVPANPWRAEVEHAVDVIGEDLATYLGLPYDKYSDF